jgi:asparagine synthase (glutamine-hydrolysing)
MSGIAVIYHADGRPVAPTMLDRMVDALAHRGPDGISRQVHGAVGLGHCLMHTTPESLGEAQPASDGDCWLVWDGRLDNRGELLQALRSERIGLGRETDPGLVLGAYRLWGRSCAEKLLGEFAFVLWDPRARSLFGARDRLGLKPFYYRQQGSTLFIASEAKALLAVLDRMPDPDDEMVLAMLLSECREPDNHRSLFDGIRRLPPGHTMSFTDGQLRLSRYWQIEPGRRTIYRQPGAYVERLLALFREAVACRTRSAFPVGSLLSGGLDSSSITTLAVATGAPVEAFTGYEVGSLSDERRFARRVSEAAGIRLWEFTARTYNPLKGLGQVLREVECPLVSTDRNADALTALLQSRRCRIVLDGEGGDQLIDEDGYLADLLIRANPLRFIRETRSYATWYGAPFNEFLELAMKDAVPAPLRALGKRLLRPIPVWINRELARRCGLPARMRSPRVTLTFPNFCQQVAYEDTLGPYFLLKLELVEREAAHAGREVWYPFLDSRLVEFVLSIPWHERCHAGERKWLLRQAMHGLLPDVIRLRKGKADWSGAVDRALEIVCRRSLPEPLANRSGVADRYLDMRGARRLVEQYLGGRRDLRWEVWNCVTLDHWLKAFWTGGHCNGEAPEVCEETLHAAQAAGVR